MITWSGDAVPTGPDDPELILSAISTASDSVWSAFRMASHHLPNETEEDWKHRRNEAFRELAPLMDRVGRLVADASSLIQSIGNEFPFPQSSIPQPIQLTIPPPPTTERGGNPREGMEQRIRTGLLEGDGVIVLNASRQHPITVSIDENLLQSQVFHSLQDLFNQQPQQSDTQSTNPILSQSVQQEQTNQTQPSLLYHFLLLFILRNRLQSLGLLSHDISTPSNSYHHLHEVDSIPSFNYSKSDSPSHSQSHTHSFFHLSISLSLPSSLLSILFHSYSHVSHFHSYSNTRSNRLEYKHR